MNALLLNPEEASRPHTASSTLARMCLPPLTMILVSGALSTPPTSSVEPHRLWEAPFLRERSATASAESDGVVPIQHLTETTRRAVWQLRRISGLTWEQMSRVFGVSRRSLHSWASGNPLNAANEERLMKTLDVVRQADRGSARANRAALLEVREGTDAIQLLASARYSEALSHLGLGGGRSSAASVDLSPEALESRAMPNPIELFDAEVDMVHRDPKQSRAARTVRNSRRGSS